VGTAIEELYGDRLGEHYEALAYHFALAENWTKALDFYELAAEKSAAAYANHAAVDHLERALAIAERLGGAVEPARRSGLLQCLGRVSFCINEFHKAGNAYAQAARIDPDPCARSQCTSQAGWCYHWGHEYAEARAAIREAAEIARTHALPHAEAFAGLMEGFADATTLGDFRSTDRWTAAAAEIGAEAEVQGDGFAAAVAATGTFCEAELAEWKGDFHLALGHFDRLLASGRLHEDPMLQTHAEWFAGKASANLGRYGEALARMQAALDRSVRIGDRAMQSRLLNTIGWCYAEIGCSRIGMDYNRRATEIGRELVELELVAGAPELYGNAAVNLAGDHIERGDLSSADEAIARIESDLSASDDPWMRWRYSLHVAHARARWWMARGEPQRALELAAVELDGSRRHRAAKIEARAHTLRAQALSRMERLEEALAAVGDALAIARAIEHPSLAWRALAVSAELRDRLGERARAAQERAEATGTLAGIAERVGADDLRRELLALGERVIAAPSAGLR
jgi:tetratricopeptide (TPR) repeat protein